ncbi:hypothetical protein JTE90_020357 [Oedothorax gibbosus]|uniref:Uncharacterized protein n=1 Tax=Oedothorax gibbosus TaxID=931172 RepID=A0AAV6TLJ9_9ARAC|nr:hypothetical protein JTE90_020357 [Oedothorax gibbosus]
MPQRNREIPAKSLKTTNYSVQQILHFRKRNRENEYGKNRHFVVSAFCAEREENGFLTCAPMSTPSLKLLVVFLRKEAYGVPVEGAAAGIRPHARFIFPRFGLRTIAPTRTVISILESQHISKSGLPTTDFSFQFNSIPRCAPSSPHQTPLAISVFVQRAGGQRVILG